MSDCIEWTGYRDRDGYGRSNGQSMHRVAYERAVGPIPEGLTIDHLCRNRACVNPEHLEAVTQRENTLRGNTTPARHASQTHCVNGHPFSEENTYRRPNGARDCRTCGRSRVAAYAERRRQA